MQTVPRPKKDDLSKLQELSKQFVPVIHGLSTHQLYKLCYVYSMLALWLWSGRVNKNTMFWLEISRLVTKKKAAFCQTQQSSPHVYASLISELHINLSAVCRNVEGRDDRSIGWSLWTRQCKPHLWTVTSNLFSALIGWVAQVFAASLMIPPGLSLLLSIFYHRWGSALLLPTRFPVNLCIAKQPCVVNTYRHKLKARPDTLTQR